MTSIRAVIGLGNPGPRFTHTRHNIGFKVLDAFAEEHNLVFERQDNAEITSYQPNDTTLWLIKPQTFMNDSGKVASFLQKKGIKAEQVLVIHDELELPFGTIKTKLGGSAKGHNGLRSLIASIGPNFHRLRMGIGRPEHKEKVPEYVLENFKSTENVEAMIKEAILKLFILPAQL